MRRHSLRADGVGRAAAGFVEGRRPFQGCGRERRICRAGWEGWGFHWRLLAVRGVVRSIRGCQVSVMSGLVVSGEVKWLID